MSSDPREGELDALPDERFAVAVLTPTAADGPMAARVLGAAGLRTIVCDDMTSLCDALGSSAGAALVAEEALGPGNAAQLLESLEAQPAWSDIPVVIMTGETQLSRAVPRALQQVAARANVTLLERPVRVTTLVTVLRSALRARQRQLDVRDHLDERQRLLASERAAREQAEASAARADDANRAKSAFLAMMSHELRTPLNAIAGYTQLLSMGVRGPVTREQGEDLERIYRSQRHLLSLINDVLNFAKLEAGHVEFDIEPVPMKDVLGDIESLILPQLREKRLRFVHQESCEPIVVRTDVEKARQILINLLSNAIKFTPPGGEIRLSCEADGAIARTSVSDSGPGVPRDKLESIFEPFVQVDRRLTSQHEGTGLGLAISRDLARHMGGDLTAESEPGKGAVFTLALPLAE